MKLTQKQTELIELYKLLEREYGRGNVFFRYINDYHRIEFVIHDTIGSDVFTILFRYKINGKVINVLEDKGLMIGRDNFHKEADPNSWRSQPKEWRYVGYQIRTELL